jgi:hypothetical protein
MTEFPPDQLPSLIPSLIRTFTPIIAGAAITWVCTMTHMVLSPGAGAVAGAMLTGTAGAAYYTLARLLERTRGERAMQRLARALGRYLLGGIHAQPVYRSSV